MSALGRKLAKAAEQRRVFDLAAESGGFVDADDFREALLEDGDKISPFGVRVSNGEIIGALSLAAVTVPFPLEFVSCVFKGLIDLDGARLQSLSLIDSQVAGVLANGVTVDRDIDFSGSTFSGALSAKASISMTSAIWLSEARVGGRLLCKGTSIQTAADRAMYCDRSTFGGNVRLVNGFRSNAELRFIGAKIEGSLDIAGATIDSVQTHRALDLGEATIGGSLFLVPTKDGQITTINGRVEMGHLRINGRLLVDSAHLVAPPPGEGGHWYLPPLDMVPTAVWAPRLNVAGDIHFLGPCVFNGQVDLSMCDVGGSLIASGQHFANPSFVAFELSSAKIAGDLRLDTRENSSGGPPVVGHVEGGLMLRSASIGGSVVAVGCKFDAPPENDSEGLRASEMVAISAPGIRIGRDLNLAGITTSNGMLWFGGAEIAGDVGLDGAALSYPEHHSASFAQAHIGGSVLLRRRTVDKTVRSFTSDGLFALNHTEIGARVVIDKGQFRWSAGSKPDFNRFGAALELLEANVRGGLVFDWEVVHGNIDCRGATSSYLADRLGNWGDRVRLTGFRYGRFATLSTDQAAPSDPWDLDARAVWLKQQDPVDPEPFEYAASVMRARGHHRDAEQLTIIGRRSMRKERLKGLSG
jgi:hypothetical protein